MHIRRSSYCQTEGCVNSVSYGFYCEKCHALRKQHETSHRLEGHDESRVLMCPKCEKKPKP